MDFEGHRADNPLLVVNCGEATARNIQVDCSSFPEDTESFERISTINKGEGKYLRKKIRNLNIIGVSIGHDFREETTFHIRYENILGKRYESKVILKTSGLFFLSEFNVVS